MYIDSSVDPRNTDPIVVDHNNTSQLSQPERTCFCELPRIYDATALRHEIVKSCRVIHVTDFGVSDDDALQRQMNPSSHFSDV